MKISKKILLSFIVVSFIFPILTNSVVSAGSVLDDVDQIEIVYDSNIDDTIPVEIDFKDELVWVPNDSFSIQSTEPVRAETGAGTSYAYRNTINTTSKITKGALTDIGVKVGVAVVLAKYTGKYGAIFGSAVFDTLYPGRVTTQTVYLSTKQSQAKNSVNDYWKNETTFYTNSARTIRLKKSNGTVEPVHTVVVKVPSVASKY